MLYAPAILLSPGRAPGRASGREPEVQGQSGRGQRPRNDSGPNTRAGGVPPLRASTELPACAGLLGGGGGCVLEESEAVGGEHLIECVRGMWGEFWEREGEMGIIEKRRRQ